MRNTIVGWILSGLLAAGFLLAGVPKLLSAPMVVQEFGLLGYPLWFMTLTGVLEVLGAILVLIPRTAFAGALLFVCIMLGALYSHLTHGQAAMIGAPLVFLAVSLALAYVRRPSAAAA